MKGLVKFLTEAKYWWDFDITNDTHVYAALSKSSGERTIFRKAYNQLGVQLSKKHGSRLPFYFDDVDLVFSGKDKDGNDNRTVFSAEKDTTVQDIIDFIKKFYEDPDNKKEIERMGYSTELKPPKEKQLKAVTQETYDKLSNVFPNLEIGNKGGLSCKLEGITFIFSEKENVLTIRYTKNGNNIARLSWGDNYDEVIEKVVKWCEKHKINLKEE